jgi:hypothetical protein
MGCDFQSDIFEGKIILVFFFCLKRMDKERRVNDFLKGGSDNEASEVHINGHMAVFGPVRHQKYIIWTEASEAHIIFFW